LKRDPQVVQRMTSGGCRAHRNTEEMTKTGNDGSGVQERKIDGECRNFRESVEEERERGGDMSLRETYDPKKT